MTRRRQFQLWAGYALMVASIFLPIGWSPFSAGSLVDSPQSLVPLFAFGLLGLTLAVLVGRPSIAWVPAVAWTGGIVWLLAEAAPWRSYDWHWRYQDGFLEGFGVSPFGWVTAFLGGLVVALVSLGELKRSATSRPVEHPAGVFS
ncbi:MAG: hypothetical protein ACHQ1G_03295 [Planctomycetota bacterium]